jgi:hypothetical protein
MFVFFLNKSGLNVKNTCSLRNKQGCHHLRLILVFDKDENHSWWKACWYKQKKKIQTHLKMETVDQEIL